MKGYTTNIEVQTASNTNFREVLYTGKHSQLVLMSLLPNEEIGMEIHFDSDQFFSVESGEGKCVIDGNEYIISEGFAVIIPAGAKHNIINTSNQEPLRMFTLYSPPHHKDAIIRTTKVAAEENDELFDGKTTEK